MESVKWNGKKTELYKKSEEVNWGRKKKAVLRKEEWVR